MSKIFEDFLDLDAFATDVKRHPRTVRRWIDKPGGLPYSKVGNRILVHVPTAREWLLGQMHNRPKIAHKATKRK
jgi:hypothetical protein